MKLIIVLVTLLSLVACTSLRAVEGTPEALRERVSRGHLVRPGESIALRTRDGRYHRMQVLSVDEVAIVGQNESVAIGDVIAIETRQPSVVKDFALGITLALLVVFVAGYYALTSGPGFTVM